MREQRNTGVAIIGARDGSLWTNLLTTNLGSWNYHGQIWPVSRSRAEVAGRRTYPSLEELPDVPDAVVIATGTEESLAIAERAIGLGVPHVVVLSDGFAERGTPEGRAHQQRLVELARAGRSRVYGPNGVGFADFRSGLTPVGAPIPTQMKVGPIGLISQSGSLLSTISGGLVEDGFGLDWCVSLGNGAAFDFGDALEYLLDRPSTTVICGYIESFGRSDRARIEALFARARDLHKPIVLIKAGGSARSQRIALSHTASIAGADRVISDIMARHGVIRVADSEELVRTVSLLAYLKHNPPQPGRGGGLGIIEGSGGTAAFVADKLQAEGVALAEFTAPTLEILRGTAPPGAFVENPVDLTASPKTPEAIDRAYGAVYRDANVAAIYVPWALTYPAGGGDGRELHTTTIERYGRLRRETGTPLIFGSANLHEWTGWMREFRAAHPDVLVVRGLGATVAALRHVFPAQPLAAAPHAAGKLIDEAEGRGVLAELNVPLVGGFLLAPPFRDIERETDRLAGPYAVKLVADGVAHRARIGAVVLGCRDGEAVARARDAILANAARAGVAAGRIHGLLIEEMVFGPELIAGLHRDPWFGPFIVLGRGGVNVEQQSGSRLLPIAATEADLAAAIDELGLVGGGARDPDVVAQTAALVARLGGAFLDGALAGYATVELNPVILTIAGPRIADVLLVQEG